MEALVALSQLVGYEKSTKSEDGTVTYHGKYLNQAAAKVIDLVFNVDPYCLDDAKLIKELEAAVAGTDATGATADDSDEASLCQRGAAALGNVVPGTRCAASAARTLAAAVAAWGVAASDACNVVLSCLAGRNPGIGSRHTRRHQRRGRSCASRRRPARRCVHGARVIRGAVLWQGSEVTAHQCCNQEGVP